MTKLSGKIQGQLPGTCGVLLDLSFRCHKVIDIQQAKDVHCIHDSKVPQMVEK